MWKELCSIPSVQDTMKEDGGVKEELTEGMGRGKTLKFKKREEASMALTYIKEGIFIK